MFVNLFATQIILVECNLDLKRIKEKCLIHAEKYKSVQKSNIGGYQGHDFVDDEIFNEIARNIPQRTDKPIKNFEIHSWININKFGDRNELHNHDSYSGNFLSGIFYVKAPPNSGNLKIHDPRSSIIFSPDMKYYNNGYRYYSVLPKENNLILFPSWLDHEVEVNNSEEDRISIAFNISNVEF